jgi:hypothetical protein
MVFAVTLGLAIYASGNCHDSVEAADQSKFDVDKYEIGTLKQIVKYHQGAAKLLKDTAESQEAERNPGSTTELKLFGFSGDPLKTKVRVKYTGSVRDMPKVRAEMISYWGKSRSIDLKYINLFKQEMLFMEGADEHWLPVQTQLLPFFEKEVKKGDYINLFTVWVGYHVMKERVDWIFLVNEFQTLPPSYKKS